MSAALEATANETVAEWESDGLELGERERSAKSLPWDIGDWWNRGQRYGERARIVGRAGWSGPTHGVCRETGRVAERWPPSKRFDTLEFWHHQIVAVLSDDVAIPLLQAAENQNLSANELRALVKQYRRATKEEQLGARQVAALSDGQRYGVIYADPPWRFEPWSRDSGMDRAADNHYPTLTLEAICALDVPAADDAVLFLWATVPMLPEALQVMAAWGFAYKSHCVWAKDYAGTGYWFRNAHELLLVGTRGSIPAPAPGSQFLSVIEAPTSAHSAKPMAFAEMIEEMFPHLPAVELFARGPRLGWTVWGNEAEEAA
jgi:N6-adenosine-specific RNA methylase IME4